MLQDLVQIVLERFLRRWKERTIKRSETEENTYASVSDGRAVDERNSIILTGKTRTIVVFLR